MAYITIATWTRLLPQVSVGRIVAINLLNGMDRSSQSFASSQPTKRRRIDRPVKSLPAPVLNYCTVCLEEQLFSQAFTLLSNSLLSGSGTSKPVLVPTPPHLALAATLIVHPRVTTRTNSADKESEADVAFDYLRTVVRVAGPKGAELRNAFRPTETGHSRSRNTRSKSRLSTQSSDEDDIHSARIRLSFADKGSIWSNATDFWSVVGWAFNCSVKYPRRWQRWKLWLELMLEVLDADLDDHSVGGNATGCLLAEYIQCIGEGRNNKRRLMRAILADGSTKSLAEFHEVWRNETRPPKEKKDDAKLSQKRKLDLDNGEFGDYFDNESEEDSTAVSGRRSRSTSAFSSRKQSRQPSDGEESNSEAGRPDEQRIAESLGVAAFGGIDSIRLRQRFLALLVRLCSQAPQVFLDTEDLFDLSTEFIKPLPLAVFQQFVLPSKAYLDIHAASSLSQTLLRPLLANTAPAYDANALTQTDFDNHYAGFAANVTSVIDNAKVSLLVESLLRLLWQHGDLIDSRVTCNRVELGIAERRTKASWDGRRKTGVKALEEEQALQVLTASSKRMMQILDMLRDE